MDPLKNSSPNRINLGGITPCIVIFLNCVQWSWLRSNMAVMPWLFDWLKNRKSLKILRTTGWKETKFDSFQDCAHWLPQMTMQLLVLQQYLSGRIFNYKFWIAFRWIYKLSSVCLPIRHNYCLRNLWNRCPNFNQN